MSRANKFEKFMLKLINQERAERGLDPLRFDSSLNSSAEEHTEWMINRDNFSHTGAGGSTAMQRMKDAGYTLSGSWKTGENLAIQSERGSSGMRDDVRDLHESLMRSPTHRANILNPKFEEIGIGIERGMFRYPSGPNLDSVAVTQNFGKTSARNSQSEDRQAKKGAAQDDGDSFQFRKSAQPAHEVEDAPLARTATLEQSSFAEGRSVLTQDWVATELGDSFLF